MVNMESDTGRIENHLRYQFYIVCKYILTEFIESEGNLTSKQRLRNDLLTLYNPTVIPQRQGYPDETVEIYLYASYIHLVGSISNLLLRKPLVK